MRVALVVPAKSFRDAKSRLGALLEVERRARLAETWLDRVLAVATEAGLERRYVVTDAEDVRAVAARHGARAVIDPRTGGLAAVVDAGLAQASAEGAVAAIVLMGDLPTIVADDVRALARALASGALVIAPDEAELGTNALGVPLPFARATRFGRDDSFVAHTELARELGLEARVVRLPGLAFDVDGAEQLARAERLTR